MDASETFASSDAGASETFPIKAGDLKRNSYVVVHERPCRVSEVTFSKTGKHGHAKATFTAIDIFNGRKYEDMCPCSHNMDAPFISRKEYTLVDIDEEDDFTCSLMDEEGNLRKDMRVDPEDEEQEAIINQFRAATAEDAEVNVRVMVVLAMGFEKLKLKGSA